MISYDEAGYFDQNAEIYISAVSEKNKNVDKLLEKLSDRAEKIKGNKKYSVNTAKLTAEERADAEHYNISPGKYRLICQIIEDHPNYMVEDLMDKSMAELKSMLTKGKGRNKG